MKDHFSIGDVPAPVVTVVTVIAIIIMGLIASKIITGITGRAIDRSKADPLLGSFVGRAVKVAIVIITVTMCLSVMGMQISTIIAIVGAAGAAIALALRDSLANVAGGVMIIVTKPFSKGDLIDIGEVSGRVFDIDLFLTTLKTFDNRTITVPNGIVNTSILVNHSSEGTRRVDCSFGIGYGDDIAEVKAIMKEVCSGCSMVLDDPAPVIGVADHGESCVMMDLKVWCDTEHYWDVKYYLEENVKTAFDRRGIKIPYPQMDVHIHDK